jgi:hypothetical protein
MSHRCRAATADTKLPPPRCRQAAAPKLPSPQPPPLHCCNAAITAAATTAAIPQPPPSCCRRAAAKLPTSPAPLSRYCNAATAAAATAAALLLPPPSCYHQAATAKLPLLPRRRQAAAAVTTAIMHAEIKHYTYVGIHNEYTLASTVIGTIRYYKT